MTSGQETEQIYSYNPGAHTRPISKKYKKKMVLKTWPLVIKYRKTSSEYNYNFVRHPTVRQTDK